MEQNKLCAEQKVTLGISVTFQGPCFSCASLVFLESPSLSSVQGNWSGFCFALSPFPDRMSLDVDAKSKPAWAQLGHIPCTGNSGHLSWEITDQTSLGPGKLGYTTNCCWYKHSLSDRIIKPLTKEQDTSWPLVKKCLRSKDLSNMPEIVPKEAQTPQEKRPSLR